MWNWIKNLFSRKAKIKRVNTTTEKSTNLSGLTVDVKDGKAGIGSFSNEKKQSPAVMTEGIAKKDLQHGQTVEVIESVDNYEKREGLKEKYAETLIGERKESSQVEKKKGINDVVVKAADFKKLNKYFTDRGFKSNELPNDLATSNGYVIWPITLQPCVSYIHTAQIQLIKLLVAAGWKLHTIIGDCGKHSATVKDTSEFKKSIVSLLERNDINIEDNTVTFLSKYFKRDAAQNDNSLLQNVDSLELLNTFHSVSESIEWFNYWEYITKNYNKTKRNELKKRKVLSNLQPLLNWTLVVTITKKYTKTIVVAGEDEKEQWDKITNLHGNNKIGMIYIQELKDGTKTMDQSEIGIGSEQEMLNKLDKGNMGQWLCNHFIELPYFLKDANIKPSFCKLSDDECKNYGDNCIKCLFGNNNKNFNDGHFDKNALVAEIYQIANPANAIT
ncbi:MAG: hypothetical protein LBF69_07450 [Prevotellaceae bacterium]|jgi:hypothetical protein|nr:hypothetical protein [Prevotellaceae bacterium]